MCLQLLVVPICGEATFDGLKNVHTLKLLKF